MKKDLSLTQEARLQQRLNPQQVIFGRYLEMNAPEIEDEVRRVVDENPAIEVVSERNGAENISDEGEFNETAEQLQMADYGNDDDMPSYHFDTAGDREADFSRDYADSSQQSMIEALAAQLPDLGLDELNQKIAVYIIGNLDDNGYMTRSLSDIADDIAISEGYDVGINEMKYVFSKVRSLDPAGIAAVDLRDCLLLQIDRFKKTLTTKIAREIISDWFDLFSKKHYEQLRSHLGVDDDELSKALAFIKSLNPKPGALLEEVSADDRLRHIVPDFAVEVDADGHATVNLLNNIPELAIEQSFMVDDNVPSPKSRRDIDAAAFIKRRRDDASAFIEMLELRATTLLAVMRSIVKIQSRFFATNDRSTIRPMIIKDIAAMTGLNISVISRAASGKYVLTPHGIYPLKMFFNERPKDDADTSSHEILDVLAKIIAAEDKKRPLSDEALSAMLAKRGYDIARRTVTKYRERLGIPVARLRKQF